MIRSLQYSASTGFIRGGLQGPKEKQTVSAVWRSRVMESQEFGHKCSWRPGSDGYITKITSAFHRWGCTHPLSFPAKCHCFPLEIKNLRLSHARMHSGS